MDLRKGQEPRRPARGRAIVAFIAGLGALAPALAAVAQDFTPARRDTVDLYGGPGTLDGKFERADGQADAQGWVAEDLTHGSVGNFGQLWKGLDDADPDQDNLSPQWAFIDDGLVVPGCGPTFCKDGMYCYGPQQMVTNITGGLSRGATGIDCAVVSPAIALHEDDGWPVLSLDAYMHNGAFPFADWLLTAYFLDATDDPAGQTGWQGYWDTFLYGGTSGQYARITVAFTPDLMPQGMRWARIRLVAVQPTIFLNSYGTPGPYFDNVRLQWVRGVVAAADLPAGPITATAVPNPFNPSVTIRWTAPAGSRTTVRVHDLSGRLVADLGTGGGSGEVVWNGRDSAGQAVAAGTYLCRITADADVRVLKLTLVR